MINPNFAIAKFAPKGLRDKILVGFCRIRKVSRIFHSTILCMRFSASKIWDTPQSQPNSRRIWLCGPSLTLGADFSIEKSGINRLKDNISLTLVEVLIAMLILSTSTAGVLGSFSYAFKFIQRAGTKISAMNYGRKTQDAFRAIWLAEGFSGRLVNNTADWTDINDPGIALWLLDDYYDAATNSYISNATDCKIFYKITDAESSLPSGTKLTSVKVTWPD